MSRGSEANSPQIQASHSSEDESEDEDPVESLVAGRAKRATAGNRLTSLIDREADDDLELLFAEDEEEEDNEFEGGDGEEASDVQLDSSSDDEDQGPAAGADDLEGEAEIQKQDRAERRKKRKAQEVFRRPKTKVKIDPTAASAAPTTPASRPKKKSERVSWLPTTEEGPVRSSSRKQTVQNKEFVHRRMQESEKRRRHQIQVMEAAAQRKEASRPKSMTQEDRMAEAARTERRNAKSLNKWEITEKKRLEEQKARLAALQNRKLQGPVISWWSGPSKWANGKLVQVGARNMVEEVRDSTIDADKQVKNDVSTGPSSTDCAVGVGDSIRVEVPIIRRPQMQSSPQDEGHGGSSQSRVHTLSTQAQDPSTFLDGIHYYASLPQQHPATNVPMPGSTQTFIHHYVPSVPPPPQPPPPPSIEISTRNLVILKNMDANLTRHPELQNHVLVRKRQSKLQSKHFVKILKRVSPNANRSKEATQELCAITGYPARYRDPKTGLPYVNAYAYKEIQKLREGGVRWSSLLGCFVGPVATAARGVPEGFLQKP